jgi:VanZ family protein
MGAIFYASAQPDLPMPSQSWLNTLLSNGGHFATYALLAFLWYRALGYVPALSVPARGSRLLLAFLLAVLYGASDEFHQSFVPGRNANLLDLAVDAAGGVVALGVIWRNKARTRRG